MRWRRRGGAGRRVGGGAASCAGRLGRGNLGNPEASSAAPRRPRGSEGRADGRSLDDVPRGGDVVVPHVAGDGVQDPRVGDERSTPLDVAVAVAGVSAGVSSVSVDPYGVDLTHFIDRLDRCSSRAPFKKHAVKARRRTRTYFSEAPIGQLPFRGSTAKTKLKRNLLAC